MPEPSQLIADALLLPDDGFAPLAGRISRTLPAVDIDRPGYPLQFYRHVLPALVRPHRLRRGQPTDYRTSFSVPADRQRRWSSLFTADPGVPFTYCNTSATIVLMRILAEAGVNFRYVRHASTELGLPLQPYACAGYRLYAADRIRTTRRSAT